MSLVARRLAALPSEDVNGLQPSEALQTTAVEAPEGEIGLLAAGPDTQTGGAGDDVFIVDDIADAVIEQVNQGTDTVQASVSYTLDANVENLLLTGLSNLNGTGNGLDNRITGNAGANRLDGGAGADSLIGGAGDDSYVVDNVLDKVSEAAGGGLDSVQSSVSFVLSAEVENLSLTGSAAINASGNGLANRLTGNAAANILNGGLGADSMTGGAGDDTYFVDDAGDKTAELAGGGLDLVQSSVTHVLSAELENLILTGTASINGSGNSLNNRITGNSGNNSLNGGIGADSMTGGAGDDTFYVDNAGDITAELAGGGVDTVRSSVSLVLSAELENLILTGTTLINGTGNALNNRLTGNAAANTLNGGLGADTLTGGAGDDLFIIDNAGDRTAELAGGGVDTVQSSVTHVLSAEVEHLTLTGSLAINGSGNSLANRITGNSANNTLNGGLGADSLIGGAGNDTYVVDNANDLTTELAGGGTDQVQASVTHSLATDIENLTLTGSSAINGSGNGLNNRITGNSAANVLDGGIGADTLTGGAGNDTYVVDNANDRAVEVAGGGTDLVQAGFSYVLGAELENLTLTGADSITGTGNDLANVLLGNGAANGLSGGLGNDTLDGGAGADSLLGGLGDDLYVLDNELDIALELPGEGGADAVLARISLILPSNIENLTLATGAGALSAAGNSLDNRLVGNESANTLAGGAGGLDTLHGGGGADSFVMQYVGSDVVEDFASGQDKITLSMTSLIVGDGDLLVEGGLKRSAPGGFSAQAEFVIFSNNVSDLSSLSAAAAAIGSATSNIAAGQTRVFAVDDGNATALLYFVSLDGDAQVEANELQWLAILNDQTNLAVTDLMFGT